MSNQGSQMELSGDSDALVYSEKVRCSKTYLHTEVEHFYIYWHFPRIGYSLISCVILLDLLYKLLSNTGHKISASPLVILA